MNNDSPTAGLYGYIPTTWVTIVFMVLFGLTTTTHLAEACYFKLWWLLPTVVLAGAGETIGWAGRYWSSRDPMALGAPLNAYLMQICCTIISPTFFIAANFLILSRLVRRVGTHYSRLSPNMYAYIFLTADFVSLVVQAVGGALASIALQNDESVDSGGHIMLGGIAFQMVSIILYTIVSVEFLARVALNKPARHAIQTDTPSFEQYPDQEKLSDRSSHFKHDNALIAGVPSPTKDRNTMLVVWQLGLSTLFIFIRSVYRTIELTNGFGGPIIENQKLFNVLDGAMVFLAMFTMNVLHPGFLGFSKRQ